MKQSEPWTHSAGCHLSFKNNPYSGWFAFVICVPGVCGGQKRELELQMTVNCYAGARNWTQVPRKSSQCPQLLSQLSSCMLVNSTNLVPMPQTLFTLCMLTPATWTQDNSVWTSQVDVVNPWHEQLKGERSYGFMVSVRRKGMMGQEVGRKREVRTKWSGVIYVVWFLFLPWGKVSKQMSNYLR